MLTRSQFILRAMDIDSTHRVEKGRRLQQQAGCELANGRVLEQRVGGTTGLEPVTSDVSRPKRVQIGEFNCSVL